MTQYEQVVKALKALGGTANVIEICDKIDFSSWKTKTPKASVSSYLSYSSQIKRKKRDGKYYYTLISDGTNNTSGKNNGLYFICLSPYVSVRVVGSLFKVGKAENISNRMYSYSNGLPFEPIQQIAFFHVPLELNLLAVEGELRETLLSSELGISKYTGGKQKEWLHTVLFDSDNKKEIRALVLKTQEMLKEIVEKKLDEIK
jgi:hypothetical protein